jgi:Family of unknown function (DUF5990)
MQEQPMSTPARIHLIVTCEAPPPDTLNGQPTEFGLQDKQQALHPGARQPDGSLRFSCEVAVRPQAATGAPDFGGPFVHGSAGGRFLYLGWRPPGGAWIRRFKIPLTSIGWEQIAAGQHRALSARVNTAHSGTVTLLGAGWVASDGT